MPISKTLALFIATALFFTSCKKDKYITDTGLHSDQTSMSTYDYLKSNNQFDTLVNLIEHFHLADSVNKASTFFAFNDDAARSFMQKIDAGDINALYDSVSSKFLTQYMFGSKIATENVTLDPVNYPNWASAVAKSSLSKTENIEYIYLNTSAPGFTYYILQYTSVLGVPDNDPGRPSDDPSDISSACQTTGIQTATGTLLHVLVNNAGLNKI